MGDCSVMTGSFANFSQEYKDFMRKFWEAQVTTYEKGAGWIYWTWKVRAPSILICSPSSGIFTDSNCAGRLYYIQNEEADDWSYSRGLAGGWIPKNPDERKYPNVCG